MLTELRNALAILVAAEARIHDLVDPTIIQSHVAAVAKANAAAIEAVLEKVNAIETQVGELVTLLTKTATELTPPAPAADLVVDPAPTPTPEPAPIVPEPLPIVITPAPAASSEPSSSEPAADSAP